MTYKIDYAGLQSFLNTLTIHQIKDGTLVKAHTRNDIDMFYPTDEDKAKITLNQVIEYGMPFLVDAIGNDLSICILTRRKYKLPTGRVIQAKFDKTIIFNCREVYGTPINEYYVIPEKFITKVN